MTYLMWERTRIVSGAHEREEGLYDSPAAHIRLTRLEALVLKHINDLLHMVRFPEVKP